MHQLTGRPGDHAGEEACQKNTDADGDKGDHDGETFGGREISVAVVTQVGIDSGIIAGNALDPADGGFHQQIDFGQPTGGEAADRLSGIKL